MRLINSLRYVFRRELLSHCMCKWQVKWINGFVMQSLECGDAKRGVHGHV